MKENYKTIRYKNRTIDIPSYKTRIYEKLSYTVLRKIINGNLTTRNEPVIYSMYKDISTLILDEKVNYIAKTDIKDFFNSIDIKILKDKLKETFDKNTSIPKENKECVMEYITNTYLAKGKVLTGSTISPILAKLYLEEALDTLNNKDIKFLNYYDDFIFFCESEDKAKEQLEEVKSIFSKVGLKLSDTKTTIKSKYENNTFTGLIFKVVRGKEFVEFNIKKTTLKRYEKRFRKYSEEVKKHFIENNEESFKKSLIKINALAHSAHSNYSFLSRFEQNFKFSNRIIDELAEFIGFIEEEIATFNSNRDLPVYLYDKNKIIRLIK